MRLIDADKLKQHYAWWNDERKDTETHACRTCRTCFARIVGYYNGIGEWKYCPHCGAKL